LKVPLISFQQSREKAAATGVAAAVGMVLHYCRTMPLQNMAQQQQWTVWRRKPPGSSMLFKMPNGKQ